MVDASSMSMQVNLFISGRKLKDMDTFSKSDPQCWLFEQQPNKQWTKIAQTEIINNNLNPDFQTSFTLAYFFEKVQRYKFMMVDADNKSGSDYDEIGEVETTMGSLMGAARQTFTANLTHKGQLNRGQLIIRTQAIEQSNMVASWSLNWQNVENVNSSCMGMCSDPAYYTCRIMKEVPGQNERFVTVATAPGQYVTQQARLPKQEIALAHLCNMGNKQDRIRFCLQTQTSGNWRDLHTCTTTIADLEAGKTTLTSGNNCTLVVDQFSVREKPSFVDYLRSGWEVSLTVAVDYTASNGEPTQPGSLHAMGAQNQYENAIFHVGSVVEPYDSDKMFPVFGFGGIPRHMGINGVNHCFAMNGQVGSPEINGIQQIVQTYRQTLPQIGLGGPTLFGPLLEEFLTMMRSKQGQLSYQILLLLTDGTIHDMPRTKDLIFQLAEMPCSIIIVGVGNADFSAMEELDGDDGGLRNTMGQLVVRDIVQFVEFNSAVARGDLAEQVLKEVPGQVCGFMERSGYVPQAQAQNLEQVQVPQQQ